MAFTYYTGVQIAKISDWDSVNNPDELTNPNDATKGIGAVRNIFFVGKDLASDEATRLQHMRAAGIKHIIETLHPATLAAPWDIPLSDWQTRITAIVNTLKGHVDAWSIGNEPSAPDAGKVGGTYWPRLRAAANICHSLDPGTPVVLAAPWDGGGIQPFLANANADFAAQTPALDIRDYIDAWDVHLYGATPGANLSQLQDRRAQVDGFTKSWAALPVYITESGWSVYAPPGAYQNAVPLGDTAGSFVAGAPKQSQSYNMRVNFENFRDNHDIQANGGLRIRAAIWYIWQDISSLKNVGAGYMGAKKARFPESVNSPQAGVQPSPVATSPNGYRPSKTVLLSFFKVYDGVALTPPTATTVTPATSITTTSATLQGTVNPNGKATTRYFGYGTTAGPPWDHVTPGVGVGTGTSAVNVSYLAQGLTSGQLYHYRCWATNTDGTDTGVDRTFTTLAPPLAPTVTAGGVTNVLATTATIFGSVNPNGSAVTNYHFEYGPTVAYGGTTAAGTLPSGNSAVLVGANLQGLTAGQTYHYRLIATNSQGTTNGPDRSFVLTAPPTGTAPELARISVLSTLLSVEITTADSRSFRWDAENADVHNRPLSIQFATQQGDGFAEASCELPRPINLDWPDLHLLDRIRFIGADGSIAYEGRVAAMPRRIDSDGEVIEIQAQGLMATAKDRTFTEIYVDRLTDRWQEPSLAIRTMIMSNNWPLGADYTVDVGNGIHFKGITNKTIPAGSQAVVQYRAPSGVKLDTLSYSGNEFNIGSIDAPTLYAADDDSLAWASWDANTLVLDGEANLRTPTITTPRSYFALRMNQTATGLVSPPPAHRRFNRIAVYGDHGVALRTNGNDPPGVYASDVMTDLIGRFCPLLNADGVGTTQTLIAHLVFDTPTTPFDAFLQLNGYHLWQLGAWEDGKVIFEPADLTSTDWQVRSDDMGLTLELSGDASDQFANGMPVSYQDVDTREQILWPTDPDTGAVLYDDLVDDDPDNDANKWGIRLEPFILEVSNPVDQNGALTLGRVALAEFNRRKAPGSVTLTLGYIEDGQGNLQPGWKVRAGQTLAITDLPNDEPRLITGTSWTEDGALQITVEQPSTRVDAVLARLETSSQARGL